MTRAHTHKLLLEAREAGDSMAHGWVTAKIFCGLVMQTLSLTTAFTQKEKQTRSDATKTAVGGAQS